MAWFVGLPSLTAADSPQAVFSQPTEPSLTVPEGHLSLRWAVSDPAAEAGWEYQLEQFFSGTQEGARIVYTGNDEGTFISGLSRSGATFRVRARSTATEQWGPWSPTLDVAVDYPSHSRVAILTVLGAGMFIILFGTIVIGARRTAGPVL